MTMLKAFDRDYFMALLILLPGFLSYQVMTYFGERPEVNEFEIIAACLAFSIVVLFFAEGIRRGLRTIRPKAKYFEGVTLGFVAVLIVTALAAGWLAAKIGTSDVLFKLFAPDQTVSTKRPMAKILRDCAPVWAKISMSDGRIYRGFLEYYEGSRANTELILNRFHLEMKGGSVKKPEKKQRLIVFGKDISSIEILPINKCDVT